MHDLQTMQDRQRRAVVREHNDAIADGNLAMAERIRKANPDIFAPCDHTGPRCVLLHGPYMGA